MNNVYQKIGIGALLVALIPALVSAAAAPLDGNNKVASYSIESLFCSGCVAGLNAAVSKIEGVVSVEVNIEEHRFQVEFNAEETDAEVLQTQIAEKTGFELRILSVREADEDGS